MLWLFPGLEALNNIYKRLLEISAQESAKGISEFPGKTIDKCDCDCFIHVQCLHHNLSLFPQLLPLVAAHQLQGGTLLYRCAEERHKWEN